MAIERKFKISDDGKSVEVETVNRESFTLDKLENIWISFTTQKNQLEAGVFAVEKKISEMKLPKSTGEIERFRKMVQDSAMLNEFDKDKRELKAMKEQLEKISKEVEELKPWYDKLKGKEQLDKENKEQSIG